MNRIDNFNKHYESISDLKKTQQLEKYGVFLIEIANQLGYNETQIKYLGEGLYGKAYQLGQDKVIKLSKDISEAITAKKLIGLPTKYLIRYYISKKIHDENLYCIVMDFAEPFVKIGKSWYHSILSLKSDSLSFEKYKFIGTLSKFIEKDRKISLDNLKYKFFKNLEKLKNYNSPTDVKYIKYVENNRNSIENYIKDIYNIFNEAEKFGIVLKDLHSDNLGIKDNHLIHFDIVGAIKSMEDVSKMDIDTLLRKKLKSLINK